MAEWPCCHDPLRFSPSRSDSVPPPTPAGGSSESRAKFVERPGDLGKCWQGGGAAWQPWASVGRVPGKAWQTLAKCWPSVLGRLDGKAWQPWPSVLGRSSWKGLASLGRVWAKAVARLVNIGQVWASSWKGLATLGKLIERLGQVLGKAWQPWPSAWKGLATFGLGHGTTSGKFRERCRFAEKDPRWWSS